MLDINYPHCWEMELDKWMNEAYMDAIYKISKTICAPQAEKLAVMIAESYHQEEQLGIDMVKMIGLSDLHLAAIRDDRSVIADMIMEHNRNQF